MLEPTPGTWDARGARVTTVLSHDPLVVLYDGRPTAEDNWHETTSVARADATGMLHADPDAPVLRSPDSDGALRYASARCPSRTARPASTSSWPAPTARTTWSRR